MSNECQVFSTTRALKELQHLPLQLRRRVAKASNGSDRLAREGRHAGVRKLGVTGWRVRVGETRTIVIYRIRHRRGAS